MADKVFSMRKENMSANKPEEDPDVELNQLFDNIRSFGKNIVEKGQQLKESITTSADPEEPVREILARIEQRLTNIERAVVAMRPAKAKKAKKKKAKKSE